MSQDDIANKLLDRNLTAVSKACGIHRTTLSRIRSQKSTAKKSTMKKLCEYLGIKEEAVNND